MSGVLDALLDGDDMEKKMVRSSRVRVVCAAAVLAVGCLAVIGSGGENTATKVDGSGAAGGAATGPFKVGDAVKLGDNTVTVNTVTNPFTSSNSMDTPDAGNHYVAVDVSVQNNGTKPQTVSSLACFSFQDSTGQKYTQALVVGAPASPNGEVDPGSTIRGTIVFEVPEAATGLQMKFKCDLFSSGSATVALS